MEFCTHSEAETEILGRRLAERLRPGAVVAYRGDLGMGKTAFPGPCPGAGLPDAGHQPNLYHC